MCGIVGYIGHRRAADILINGLQRLEYRGYDSAGMAIVNGTLSIAKKAGKVQQLQSHVGGNPLEGTVGIAHTRWATHGAPTDVNAHPHVSSDGSFALVHNGIIENWAVIRHSLSERGYTFESETDTEVLVRLIEALQKEANLPLEEALRQALRQVTGTYGLALISTQNPDQLIVARHGSPLLIGIGENEFIVGSDASPVIEYTKHVVYLHDGEIGVIGRDGYSVSSVDNSPREKEVHELEWNLGQIQRNGYEHFMLKEIMEQPTAITDSTRGRINLTDNEIRLGGLSQIQDTLVNARRIIICGCGSSWHAGLIGEYLLEHLANVPVEVEYASEFRYRQAPLHENDVVLVISQSGETADTLAAVRKAKTNNIPVIGICNVIGSSIARETQAGVYLHAGPEIGVASTKAFTGQVSVLTMIALMLGRQRGHISSGTMRRYLKSFLAIPGQIESVLAQKETLMQMARIYRYATNFLYLGRGYNYPVALEGALKLKEISYIHAEGYPAAEMKHGPIALIDPFMPVVCIAMKDHTYDKVVANIEEIVARKGVIIALTDDGNHELDRLCEHVIRVPSTEDFLTPLVTVVPLQLLAYYIAVLRGCDVDQPRNLAKSVTVE